MNKIAKWMNINSKHKILIIFLISFILISGQCSNTENDATVIAAEQVQTEIEEETEEIAAEPELETEKEEQITIGPYTYLIAAQTATQQNEIHLERPAIWTNQNGTGFKELLPLKENEDIYNVIDTDMYVIFKGGIITGAPWYPDTFISSTYIYRKSDGYIFEYPVDYAFGQYLVQRNENILTLLDIIQEGIISVVKEITISDLPKRDSWSWSISFLDGFIIWMVL